MKKLGLTTLIALCCVMATKWVVASSLPSAKLNHHASVVDGIVAIVNNDVITQTRLNKQLAIITSRLKRHHTPLPPRLALAKQVLNQLINQTLQLQLAKRNSMKVTDKTIDAAITTIANRQHQEVLQIYKQAANDGLDYQAFRQQIKNELIIQQLQQRVMAERIDISAQEIDNYLHQLANNPNVTTQYHVGDILVALTATPSPQQVAQARKRAHAIVAQLRHGANFEQLAIAHSGSQNALKGGDLGWRRLAQLPDAFAKKVVTMSPGQIASPIRSANGFHIIKLIARRHSALQKQVVQANIEQMVLKSSVHRLPAKTLQLAQNIRLQLLRGDDFSKLAEKYSSGVNASKGGYVGWVDVNDINKPLTKVIMQLKAGSVSQPIMVGRDYYLIKVIGRRHHIVAASNQRQQIAQLLFERKMLESLQTWINQLRGQAYIKIMPPYTH